MHFYTNIIFYTILQLFSTNYCYKQSKSPSFEVRAILVNCINSECDELNKSETVSKQSGGIKKPDTCIKKNEGLTNCFQKLLLTIKIFNEGINCNKNQYIVIDHITDEITQNKIMLLEPIVVKFNQEPVLEIYDLTFENMVNSEATEKVFNKRNKNYKGCDKNLCGAVKYNEEIIPYSSGFCCSCNPNEKSVNRALYSSKRAEDEYSKHQVRQNYNNRNNQFMIEPNAKYYNENTNKMVYGLTDQADNVVKAKNYRKSNKKRRVFEEFFPAEQQMMTPSRVYQRRGGQSCANDVYGPPGDQNPDSSQDSTHCLQFSDEWYSVYKLEEPKLYHSIKIQVYQKYEDHCGNTIWKDLTHGQTLKVGTKQIKSFSENIFIKYSSKCGDFALDYRTQTLLIPEESNKDHNIEDSLVLSKKLVSAEGKQCDVAGVGFEAFFKQEKRCSVPKGSCLHNQPKQLLMQDKAAEQEGNKGKHLLKYYAPPVPNQKIDQNISLYHTKPCTVVLDLQIKADYVALLQPHSSAIITEVYTESTNPQKTRIVAKVTNSGLVSGIFFITLNGCSLDVPASFNNIASKPVLINPQHQHIFILNIECALPVDKFYCLLNVFNVNHELIALKQIRFQKFDRCICIWHCACTCLLADEELKCQVLSLDNYHAAGFQGGLPVSTRLVELSDFDRMLSTLFHLFIYLTFTLLIMGFIKAIIGLFCCNVIGFWGIDVILGLSANEKFSKESIDSSKSSSRSCCPVRSTSKEQFRYISRQAQFWLNVVFFFIYPLAALNIIVRKLFFVSYTNEKDFDDDDECQCGDDDDDDQRSGNARYRGPNVGRSYVILPEDSMEGNISYASFVNVTE